MFKSLWNKTVSLFRSNPYNDLPEWEAFMLAYIQMQYDRTEEDRVQISYSEFRNASERYGGKYSSSQKIKEAISSLEDQGLITREIVNSTSTFTVHNPYPNAPYLSWTMPSNDDEMQAVDA